MPSRFIRKSAAKNTPRSGCRATPRDAHLLRSQGLLEASDRGVVERSRMKQGLDSPQTFLRGIDRAGDAAASHRPLRRAQRDDQIIELQYALATRASDQVALRIELPALRGPASTMSFCSG